MVRDAVLLELPLAPLCDEDCAGLCPTCGVEPQRGRPATASPRCDDPRWAALDDLKFERLTDYPIARSPGPGVQPAAVHRARSRRWPSRRRRPSQGEEPQPPGRELEARRARPQHLPALRAAKLPHVVCRTCGWYHGRQAIDVD